MSVAQEWKLGAVIHLDKSTENEVATHAGHVIEMAIESNQRGAMLRSQKFPDPRRQCPIKYALLTPWLGY